MAAPFTLAMVEGGGTLQLQGVEAFELDTPTTVTGTIDVSDDETAGTGAFTNGTFSTPDVHLEMDITSPAVATVVVDVAFSQTTPGNVTGSIDSDGNVVIQTVLHADLDIEAQPQGGGDPFLTAVCRTTPINLLLESTAPYDSETDQVTVVDADFTVPPVVAEPACTEIVAGAVDDLIAGSGHSLSLTLDGELEVPDPPGQPSVTTLEVSPGGTSTLGDPVTLTATVAAGPDAETDVIPAGLVDFLDGDTILGTESLVDGQASLVTPNLPGGTRSLRVRYRGGDGVYSRSASPVIFHTVTANPAIVADVPSHLYVGGEAQEFDVRAVNTGFGIGVSNARIDITIERIQGQTAPLTPDRVVLEYKDSEGTWQPVTLNQPAVRVLVGSLGSETGFPLPLGSEVTRRLRISLPEVGTQPTSTNCTAAHVTCPGTFVVGLDVVAVDPALGTPTAVRSPAPGALATGVTQSLVVASAKRTPIFAPLALSAPVVRQGGTFSIDGIRVGPALSGYWPSGEIAVDLDGRRLGIRRFLFTPLESGWQPTAPVESGPVGLKTLVKLPSEVTVGDHSLVVRYLGSLNHEPITTTLNLTVAPSAGTLFECTRQGVSNTDRYTLEVVGSTGLPTYHAAGSPLDLSALGVKLVASRSAAVVQMLQEAMGDGPQIVGELHSLGQKVDGITLGFGEFGSATVSGYAREGTVMTSPTDPVLDQTVTFSPTDVELTVTGDPGTAVPIVLDRVVIRSTSQVAGAPVLNDCVPVGDPLVFGTATLVGTGLDASTDQIREGEAITLDAVSLPASPGLVEFRDGSTTIGVVPVDAEGRASMTTSSLAQGVRQVTARFLGGLSIPSTTSPVVEVLVLPPLACKEFAVEGHGATVRLVYLELLGRCPDQAGFAYWVARLDAGLSSEAFARIIAATPEAVGRVVDDAYRTMLDRPADAAGRVFWTGRLQAHGRYDRLLADLGASDEFWTRAGATNEGFVTRVYERLLNRAPEQSGLDYWVGRLEGGTSRRVLILSLAILDEPLGVLVQDSYDEILDRAPDAGERSDGIAHLRSTGDRSGLYAELIGRPEFATRAGTFPNPGD